MLYLLLLSSLALSLFFRWASAANATSLLITICLLLLAPTLHHLRVLVIVHGVAIPASHKRSVGSATRMQTKADYSQKRTLFSIA